MSDKNSNTGNFVPKLRDLSDTGNDLHLDGARAFDASQWFTDAPDDCVIQISARDLRSYYDIASLMCAIGERNNKGVMVRFDPLRDDKKFTVCVGNFRIADCDDPGAVLIEFFNER